MIHNPLPVKHLALICSAISACHANAENIKFNGFFQASAGYNDATERQYLGWSEDKLVFDHNILALQATSELTDKASATVQLIARGTENTYGVSAEWAYLTYDISSTLKIRAGRLRAPLYMYSDYLEVGYAYPWITPPYEVYYIPFNNVDGIDLYKIGTFGAYNWSMQTYFGNYNDKYDVNNSGIMAPVKSREKMGLVFNLGKDWWDFRISYHTTLESIDVSAYPFPAEAQAAPLKNFGDLSQAARGFGWNTFADEFEVKNDRTNYKQIGWNIDTGRFLSIAEYTQLEIKNSYWPKSNRYFALFGVRHRDYVFHYTFQQSNDTAAKPQLALASVVPKTELEAYAVEGLKRLGEGIASGSAINRNVNTLGVRWDANKNTAFKFDYHQVNDKNYSNQNIYTIAIQALF